MESEKGKDGSDKPEFIYEKVKSKVWKGNYAPVGKVWYIVKFKVGKTLYTNSMRMDCEGVTPEKEEVLFEALWDNLRKKFKLDLSKK